MRVAGAVSVCKLKLCLTPNLWLLFGYKTGLFIGWTAVAGRGKNTDVAELLKRTFAETFVFLFFEVCVRLAVEKAETARGYRVGIMREKGGGAIWESTGSYKYVDPQSTYIYRAPQCMSPRWNSNDWRNA